MKQRLIIVFVFALVVSAVASILLYRVIASQMSVAKAAKPPDQVLVAARSLAIGDLIKDGDVKIADWGGTIPQGALLKPEDAIGRGVVEPIYEGEPILDSRVAAKGAGAGLAAIIPPGMRAVAVRVNDIAGVAGFVTPGMHVDILIAGTPPTATASGLGTQSKTLLQNMQVLSAGQDIQKDNEGKPANVGVVNLLATPEQAEVLSLASNEMRLQMVLRNPTDVEKPKTQSTAVQYLFTGVDGMPGPQAPKLPAPAKRAAPPPAPVLVAEKPKVDAPKPLPITVEVISGSRKMEATFQP